MEESPSEMEENGAESTNTFATSLLICAVSTQNLQLPNLQCTHLTCEQFLLIMSHRQHAPGGSSKGGRNEGESSSEEKIITMNNYPFFFFPPQFGLLFTVH